MEPSTNPFWSTDTTACISSLKTTTNGLSDDEAKKRLVTYGANRLQQKKRSDVITLLVAQFKSPIILILLAATLLSLFLRNLVDASIILTIVILSGNGIYKEDYKQGNEVSKSLLEEQIKNRQKLAEKVRKVGFKIIEAYSHNTNIAITTSFDPRNGLLNIELQKYIPKGMKIGKLDKLNLNQSGFFYLKTCTCAVGLV